MTLPWPDAIRILKKRSMIVRGIQDELLVGSIQAFMGWRAFLIVARGSATSAPSERQQCRALMTHVLPKYPALHTSATSLIRILTSLGRQSPAVLAEWYAEDDDDPAEKERKVSRARRRIVSLQRAADGGQLAGSDTAADLADDMYAIRSAAIAHASVYTSGNLFPKMIGAFGELTACSACAGIADRANLPLDTVLAEASQDVG